MPLDKSGSKESVGKNIKELKASGRPQKQAVAIAMDTQRRAKGYNKGGPVVGPSEAPVAAANLLDTATNATTSTLGPWQGLRRGGKAGWRRGL